MKTEEFSKLLKEARKMSGLNTVEIVTKAQKTEGAIKALLNCKFDNTLSKIIEFLDVIGFQIVVITQDKEVALQTFQEVSEFITRLITDMEQSLNALEKMLNVSHQTLGRRLKGGPIRLSVFLKLLNLNHYTLRLDAKI
jgi:hypothetical protein